MFRPDVFNEFLIATFSALLIAIYFFWFRQRGHIWLIVLGGFLFVLGALVVHLRRSDHFYAFLIVELAGLFTAFYAAFEAENAANESQQTQEQLRDLGLLVAEAQPDFDKIFDEHLVQQLQRNRENAEIFLLLSTPAYGYAVVGKDRFSDFEVAMKQLHNCKVEMIVFSPDAHFYYWCNVVLWSIGRRDAAQRSLRQEEAEFAIEFATKTLDIVDDIHNKDDWHIWVTKETTVRLFAFSKTEVEGSYPFRKAYVLLTDQFSIPQDQFRERFKVRSIPIPLTQIKEYVGGQTNYFDRIKQCPYTFRDQVDARVKQDHLHQLAWDYVFGRTLEMQFEKFELFKSEILQFLGNVRGEDNLLQDKSSQEILTLSLTTTIRYFAHVFYLYDTRSRRDVGISDTQKARIIYAMQQAEKLNISTQSLRDSLSSLAKKDSDLQVLLDQANQEAVTETAVVYHMIRNELDTELNQLREMEDKLIFCLYTLMCSGFGQSGYAYKVITEKKQ